MPAIEVLNSHSLFRRSTTAELHLWPRCRWRINQGEDVSVLVAVAISQEPLLEMILAWGSEESTVE
jgi:hypothetical protein